MTLINCFTNGFAGQRSTVPGKAPVQMEWVYYQDPFPGVTIFEGGHAFEYDPRVIDTQYRVAWLTEAEAEKPHMYAEIESIADRYDVVVTPSRALAERRADKFVLMPRLGVRVPSERWGFYQKSKHVALCLSDKGSCPGHRLRQQVAAAFQGTVDVFNPYDREKDLPPYRFAIVIEVSQEQDFITEHVLDALALGCVPIYWGPPTVGEWLDERGIPSWSTLEDLHTMLERFMAAPDAYYMYYAQYVAANQRRLRAYEIPEDWLVSHVLRPRGMLVEET